MLPYEGYPRLTRRGYSIAKNSMGRVAHLSGGLGMRLLESAPVMARKAQPPNFLFFQVRCESNQCPY
jgi:hypothetical protein